MVDSQAQAPGGIGAGRQPQAGTGKAAIRPRDARQLRLGQSFAQVVAVLMRDRNFRQMPLADLEWLVLPPIMSGQFRLAQMPAPSGRAAGSAPGGAAKAQDAGMLVPVAVALWARVSDSIDKQLSESVDKLVRLHPAHWASGENIWLMAVGGDQRVIPKFLNQLADTEFKGQRVKMRVRGPDSTVVIKTLSPTAPA